MPGRRQLLGQHMLVDRRVVEKIVRAADIAGDEVVLEVGTGLGTLTSELCQRARRVISYELDPALYQKSKEHLKFENLHLVMGDAFDIENLAFDVFVSNLPYSRSRDAIEWLATRKLSRAIVMVQREFAEKIQAAPGDRNYRAISALANHCFRIEQITAVGRGSFSPRPKVDSVVMKLVPAQRRAVSFAVVKRLNWLFSRRNKKASSVAAKIGLVDLDLGDRRIYQLPPSTLVEFAEKIEHGQHIQTV
jgi:16S rRNA (adenine1518-N6/adenine1519-N6)-dimethyltransferase